MIDVSSNNREPDWKRVHQAGQRRAYIKLSEGTGNVIMSLSHFERLVDRGK